MKKLLLNLTSLLLILNANAQYTTPDTGINWDMDSLVLYSGGVVINPSTDVYQITADLEIAESDTLDIFAAITVNLDSNITVTVRGKFFADFFTDVIFTATDTDKPYRGFRFESTAVTQFRNTIFSYGGGIKVLNADFSMQFCTIHHNDIILNTGAAIEVSTGQPIFVNNSFIANKGAAISSAANAQVAPIIFFNIFQGNNTANSNRPQINLGPSGIDTTFIIENTITGNGELDQVGGIGFSSLFGTDCNVSIIDNVIEDNRYGIAIIGNGVYAFIKGNTLTNNNTQGDPLLGGSGINLNSTSESIAIIRENIITGNLWGVTIQGSFLVNMGDDDVEDPNPGLNSFDNNGNEGEIYALYNNTPNPVSALNNCWIASEDITLEQAESVIFHQNDDPSLGLVNFDPFWNCGFVDGILDPVLTNQVVLYPNPANAFINIDLPAELKVAKYEIKSVSGQLIKSVSQKYESNIKIDVQGFNSGLYIIELQTNKGNLLKKLIINN